MSLQDILEPLEATGHVVYEDGSTNFGTPNNAEVDDGPAPRTATGTTDTPETTTDSDRVD